MEAVLLARVVAIVISLFGVLALLPVVFRFYKPQTVPSRAEMATFSLFGAKLKAPVAGVVGSVWLIVGFLLFLHADKRINDHSVAAAIKSLGSCRSEVDSLRGVISDLEVELATAGRDTASDFISNLQFELGTPLARLGSGVEAVLRGTEDGSIDVLEISGAGAYSLSLDSEFIPVAGLASIFYRDQRTAYVSVEGGDVWRISYLGLNQRTGYNRFRFLRVR